jgi:hypothetical protein
LNLKIKFKSGEIKDYVAESLKFFGHFLVVVENGQETLIPVVDIESVIKELKQFNKVRGVA